MYYFCAPLSRLVHSIVKYIVFRTVRDSWENLFETAMKLNLVRNIGFIVVLLLLQCAQGVSFNAVIYN